MSIQQGPSFKANESISAYTVVALNASSNGDNLLVELADTNTSIAVGIIQDDVSTNGSADIVTIGQARGMCGASVTVGLVTWQTATGKVINTTNNTYTTVAPVIGTALEAGSTNAVIKIIVNPSLNYTT